MTNDRFAAIPSSNFGHGIRRSTRGNQRQPGGRGTPAFGLRGSTTVVRPACLRERGFEHVLVNMGEGLALGPKWDGGAWTIGIANPLEPTAILTELSLNQGAVATSGGYGCRFDRAGRFTHILDPKTGEPARRWASVTVIADGATLADGLSTALSVAPAEMVSTILRGRGRVYLVPFGRGNAHWL
jgi:FAD:protein FMN transferase